MANAIIRRQMRKVATAKAVAELKKEELKPVVVEEAKPVEEVVIETVATVEESVPATTTVKKKKTAT